MFEGLALRALLGKLPWRIILPGIGALLLVLFIYRAGEKHERERLQPKIVAALHERDVALANVADLQGALAKQSAAVDAAGKQTKAAQDMAAGAARMAQERGKALAGVKARLDAAARAGGPVAACKTSPVAVDAWKVM